MTRSKTHKPIQEPLIQCKWCGKEKKQTQYFKCSIENHVNICSDCINKKYTDLCDKTDKAKAILICCHYLDIAFKYDIFKSLAIGEGIGIYIRQLNLRQNPDNFEQGILSGSFELITDPKEHIRNQAKDKISSIINELEMIRNDI